MTPEAEFEHQPLVRLSADGQLMGFRHEWFMIGSETYREHELLNQLWDAGHAPWRSGHKVIDQYAERSTRP